jgi:chemosensory pili system protein ChpA (sensor histidine kinase/response regulator)
LIGMLAISPSGATADEELQPTAYAFRALCVRLSRLLAQAGMSDCVRSLTNLEPAIAALPADEAFRDVDAALTYLRGRIRDVTLPSATTAPTPSTLPVPSATPSGTYEEDVSIGSSDVALADDTSDDAEPTAADGDPIRPDTTDTTDTTDTAPNLTGAAQDVAQSEPAATIGSSEDSAAPDAVDTPSENLDDSALPTEARAAVQKFRNAALRQRAPGEIAPVSPHPRAHAISNELPEHMRRAFLMEGASDLADLRTLVASFSKMPGSLDDLHAMALLGHKVKGTAATYLYPHVADIMHCFESLPRVLQPVAVSQAATCRSLLIRFADVIEMALTEAGEQGDASDASVAEAEAILAEARALATRVADALPATGATDADNAPLSMAESIAQRATIQLPVVHRGDDDSQLRIEARQFDNLMHQADGLAMNRAMLAQTSEEIRRVQSEIEHVLTRLADLSAQLNDLNPLVRQGGATSQSASSGPRWLVRRETSVGVWSDLELDSFTSFDDALRALSEAVLDASTLSGSLQGQIQRLTRNSDAQRAVLHNMQQTIIHLRLVSLKSLADRFTLAAYQVAQAVGKQIEVSISGEDTEIDRNISEALIAPIVQLARNAVAHGIESPAEREAHHKSVVGRVWFHATYSGGEVSIEVGDDGRGINPHQLIAAAVAARIVDAKHADFLTREQALRLMFEPHLSTHEQASVIAGHGIGLDSVAADIGRLRGQVTARSEQGQGTIFQIRVPISLSITRALFVRVANNEYAIPFSAVRQMFTVPEAAILVSLSESEGESAAMRFPRRVRIARGTPQRPLRASADATAALYDEAPVFSLGELLGIVEQPSANHFALLVDVGPRQVAILVDEVLDESEIVIRSLPAHLRRRAVRGASIAPDGRLFLVLDLAELLEDALGGKAAPRPMSESASEPVGPHIPRALIVDDSISMRRALQGTLTVAGYDARLARDGVEALGMMLADLPDVVILDLEMPRLDGLELLSVIRGNAALAHVPVIILTSRAAEKHHQRALELGALAYLTKPCPDDVLITTLQRVLREPRQSS